MWFVFRLLAAIGIFCFKWFKLRFDSDPSGIFQGQNYFTKTSKNKRGAITNFSIGFKLNGPALLEFKKEGAIARFFKNIGLATELQLDDPQFDKDVYIVCDHLFLSKSLKNSAELKDFVTFIFKQGFTRIHLDGAYIWLSGLSGKENTSNEILTPFLEFKIRLENLFRNMPSRWEDKFIWRATLVEALAWSFVGFGIPTLIEMIFHTEDYYLNPNAVMFSGLTCGATAAGIFIFFYIILLQGSSRIVPLFESSILTLLALPILGIQMVSDINREFDAASPIVIESTIANKKIQEHRGRRGRKSYSYHIRTNSIEVPSNIRISKDIYDQLSVGGPVKIEIGPGRLGYRWYRKISI